MKPAAQRRRQWARDRMQTAESLGITEAAAETILDELPYSTIPDWHDVIRVVSAVRDAESTDSRVDR